MKWKERHQELLERLPAQGSCCLAQSKSCTSPLKTSQPAFTNAEAFTPRVFSRHASHAVHGRAGTGPEDQISPKSSYTEVGRLSSTDSSCPVQPGPTEELGIFSTRL